MSPGTSALPILPDCLDLSLSLCFSSHCCFPLSFCSFRLKPWVLILNSCVLLPLVCRTVFCLLISWLSTQSTDLVPCCPLVLLLPVHFTFIPVGHSQTSAFPATILAGSSFSEYPCLHFLLVRAYSASFLIEGRQKTKEERGAFDQYIIASVPVILCVLSPSRPQVLSGSLYLKTQESLWCPGWAPHWTSAHIWCHCKIIFFSLAALAFN